MEIVDLDVLLGQSDIDKSHYSLYNFNIKISEHNGSLNIELFDVMHDASKWKVGVKELEAIDNRLTKKNFKAFSMYGEKSYESMVYIPSSIKFEHESIETSTVFDTINKIEYVISEASIDFIFYLMHTLSNGLYPAEFLNELRGRLKRNLMWKAVGIFTDEENEKYMMTPGKESFFQDVEQSSNIYTLKIKSEEEHDISFFQKLASSFLFNTSYTLDKSIIEVKSLDEVLDFKKNSTASKGKSVNPPRRLYNKELVYYYQLGISAETIALKFLFHYQVLEYFYKTVYDEFLVGEVKNTITRPDFSYSDDDSIKVLIQAIIKNIKLNTTTDSYYSEQKALELVLIKYISNEKIDAFSNECDSNLIDYYKKNKVPFSDGSKVDFSDKNTFYQNLASRIYKTRNSIVHNKEGEKFKYIPYEHGEYLKKELPLLKYVCQETIIESSTLLDMNK